MLLTLEVEVDVCVAVPELVEGVAPVHAAVLQARVLDGQRQNVLVLLQRTAPAIDMIKVQNDMIEVDVKRPTRIVSACSP